jgi:hypothetical protein
MKIGFIITPYKNEELIKEELIPINDQRPWLQNVNSKFIIEFKNKEWVSDDISIYYYLKNTYKQYIFEYILGNDRHIYEKVQRCDIVFLLIFDMLEAFHILSNSQFNEMKRTFMLPNVYPPYIFQNFINNKNKYYDYLKEKNINVLPMVYISSEEFKNNPKVVKKVMEMQRGDDDSFIGKPIFGQEKIDFEKFNKQTQKYKVVKYLERISALYDGCIFQPYIKGLEQNYEFRNFFIGEKYVYTIRTKFIIVNNKQDQESVFVDMNDHPDNIEIVNFAKKVFSKLPQLKMGNQYVEKLVTRIDIGCCFGIPKYFVSEVEFVPSLYTNIQEVVKIMIDKTMGDQIIKIIEQINFSSLTTRYNKNYIIIICSCVVFILLVFIYALYIVFS